MIWAHTGIGGASPERVRSLLTRYPSLMGELSYRPGLTDSEGRVSAPWRALMVEFPERFMVGSDTWVNARWQGYEGLMTDARRWLGSLPDGLAQRIAWRNGRPCLACRWNDAAMKKAGAEHRLLVQGAPPAERGPQNGITSGGR